MATRRRRVSSPTERKSRRLNSTTARYSLETRAMPMRKPGMAATTAAQRRAVASWRKTERAVRKVRGMTRERMAIAKQRSSRTWVERWAWRAASSTGLMIHPASARNRRRWRRGAAEAADGKPRLAWSVCIWIGTRCRWCTWRRKGGLGESREPTAIKRSRRRSGTGRRSGDACKAAESRPAVLDSPHRWCRLLLTRQSPPRPCRIGRGIPARQDRAGLLLPFVQSRRHAPDDRRLFLHQVARLGDVLPQVEQLPPPVPHREVALGAVERGPNGVARFGLADAGFVVGDPVADFKNQYLLQGPLFEFIRRGFYLTAGWWGKGRRILTVPLVMIK